MKAYIYRPHPLLHVNSSCYYMLELRSMQIMAMFLLCLNVTIYRTIDRYDEECDFALMSIEPCWAYNISRDRRTIIIKKAMANRDGCAAH